MSGPRTRPAFHSEEAEHRATVAAAFVRGLLSGALARGLDAAPMLAAAGLGPAHLEDEHRTPIAAYAALYNEVVRTLGDEGFGLFPAPLRPGTFEFLCRGTIGASSLGQALGRAARFLAVVLPEIDVRLVVVAQIARLEIGERRRPRARASDPRRVFAFEWLLRLLHGLACWLAGRALTLESVAFPYPRPAHAGEYARVYTEHSSFGAPQLIAELDARLLELPVRRTEADLATFLDGAPGKIAMLYRRDREVAAAVRSVLADSLREASPLESVAKSLHLSARTLHRRLTEEGTSFRAIKDRLRHDRALQALAKTQRSVAEIASELGYSEPSAFFRAFVAWTGQAPTSYRKSNNPTGRTRRQAVR